MITGSNKQRIEQEIVSPINFVCKGREFFFQKTGLNLQSSDDWFNHFETKEIFHKYSEVDQENRLK